MQFRERRQVIQLIRTVYDPEIKRGRSEMVGRMDRDVPEIDAELRQACSEEEIQEIEEFLEARTAMLSEGAVRDSVTGLARHMRLAESYFRTQHDPDAARLAAEIFTAWDDLKKAIHKAGYRKKGPQN